MGLELSLVQSELTLYCLEVIQLVRDGCQTIVEGSSLRIERPHGCFEVVRRHNGASPTRQSEMITDVKKMRLLV